MKQVWENLQEIRTAAPLVHNITNYVVMNTTANALLAIGASPVMAHAVEEVEAMVGFARALVLNIGTLSSAWIEAMLRAGKAAKLRSVPIVLDPVGAGATRLRTDTVLRLLDEATPTVIRGNASEIRALCDSLAITKGVDSTDSVDSALEAANKLVERYSLVVSISGPTDIIVGKDQVSRVHNGCAMMTRVTGMGCTASALTGAFLAVEASPFHAATQAMVTMGVAGELTAARASGPGTFQVQFLDVLYALDRAELEARARVEDA
jgi:hydroxyethylthiazole kinase